MFQAATLDHESGKLVERRLPAACEALAGCASELDGKPVAIEATRGWRRVVREQQARRLTDTSGDSHLTGFRR